MSLDLELHLLCPQLGAEVRVYEGNITHNLGTMARAAGIYTELWHPEDVGITTADQLISPLTVGLEDLKADPAVYKRLDSPNGRGTYDQFVPWVEKVLEACIKYPNATVVADR